MRVLNLTELQQIAGGQQPVPQTPYQRSFAKSLYEHIQKNVANNPELKEIFSEEVFPMLAGIFIAGALTGAVLAVAFRDEEK